MWNKHMILIDNPYCSPTKYNPNNKFCPMGIINREKYCNWISEQLKKCGFKTKPVGSSWGVLIDEK